jgi:hypothetical protein
MIGEEAPVATTKPMVICFLIWTSIQRLDSLKVIVDKIAALPVYSNRSITRSIKASPELTGYGRR